VTVNPAACNDPITSLQLEPSAHAPWTSTTFGLSLMLKIVSFESAASHESTDSFSQSPTRSVKASRNCARAVISSFGNIR